MTPFIVPCVQYDQLRRLRWVWYIAAWGKSKIYTEFWQGKLDGRDCYEGLEVDASKVRYI
jgi:hypothetical protein